MTKKPSQKDTQLTFKKWYINSTPQDVNALAKMADTSVAYINQIISGHRQPSADLALRLYQGMITLSLTRHGEATEKTVVPLGSMSKTCASCPFYLKCGETIIK